MSKELITTNETKKIMANKLIAGDIESWSDEDQMTGYAILTKIESLLKKRKALLKEKLRPLAEKDGKTNSKGTCELGLGDDGGKIIIETRQPINDGEIEALLKKKKIPLTDAGNLVFKRDDDKIISLIQNETISADDIESCKVTGSTVFKVMAPKAVKALVIPKEE